MKPSLVVIICFISLNALSQSPITRYKSTLQAREDSVLKAMSQEDTLAYKVLKGMIELDRIYYSKAMQKDWVGIAKVLKSDSLLKVISQGDPTVYKILKARSTFFKTQEPGAIFENWMLAMTRDHLEEPYKHLLTSNGSPNLEARSPENKSTEQQLRDYQNSNVLSICVLIFGGILYCIVFAHLLFRKQGIGNLTFKLIGIILVITASAFIIVAGFSNQQITPVIGLLGTIIGYMLGSKNNDDPTSPFDKRSEGTT